MNNLYRQIVNCISFILIFWVYFFSICLSITNVYAGGGILIMKLLKLSPTFAVVEYNGQKIIVRKYYPKPGEPLLGATTNMGLLAPCIGSYVLAVYNDYGGYGEILGLYCASKYSPDLRNSVRRGNLKGLVLVIPDEYLKLK